MNKRNDKGITLIALVVTIIVLFILAGISITVLSGDNGLIDRAYQAKIETKKATIEEQVNLAKTNLKIERKDITASNVKDYLIEYNVYGEEEIQIQDKDGDENSEILKIQDEEFEFSKGIVVIYFQKGDKWTSNDVYAYAWNGDENNASWPGERMELVDEEERIYKYTVPAKFHRKNIIFNEYNQDKQYNGYEGIQTVDLNIAENGYIFKPRNSTDSRTVYFSTNHTGNVKIYIWKDGGAEYSSWPGVSATYVKEADERRYFKYEIPQSYDRFIFSDVKDDNTVKSQTYDLSFKGGGYLYDFANGNDYKKGVGIKVYSDGTWEKYNK